MDDILSNIEFLTVTLTDEEKWALDEIQNVQEYLALLYSNPYNIRFETVYMLQTRLYEARKVLNNDGK